MNPEERSTSSLGASATAHLYDDQGQRDVNSTVGSPKPNVKTLGDCLSYFGLDRRWQQLMELKEKVERGSKTAEEYDAEWKRFDKQLQKLFHTYHPDLVTRRGGSEEELAHARELQAALNQTRTVLNAVNDKILEGFDFKKKKVPVWFTEVEAVKQALEFAHLRKMDMETHMDMEGEASEAAETYRDFYSNMERVMGAVLDRKPGAGRQVTELNDLYDGLLARSYFLKGVHVSYFTHVRLHPHKQFQDDQDELERMFMLAHYMAVKQENTRLKKDLEELLRLIETRNGDAAWTEEAANDTRNLLASATLNRGLV